MALLKFTNVASSFQGGVPLVLNGENLISIYADNTDSGCFVINLNSEADQAFGTFTNVGQIILTGDTGYADFAKEVNEAMTSAPSASVIPVHTTAEISTFSYL
jgi:hypothetical protein